MNTTLLMAGIEAIFRLLGNTAEGVQVKKHAVYSTRCIVSIIHRQPCSRGSASHRFRRLCGVEAKSELIKLICFCMKISTCWKHRFISICDQLIHNLNRAYICSLIVIENLDLVRCIILYKM